MTPNQAKSASATFRLSREEYEESKKACSGLGYKSFSEFARMAVLAKIRNGERPESPQTDPRLDHFEQVVFEISRLLRQICDVIEGLEAKKG